MIDEQLREFAQTLQFVEVFGSTFHNPNANGGTSTQLGADQSNVVAVLRTLENCYLKMIAGKRMNERVSYRHGYLQIDLPACRGPDYPDADGESAADEKSQ